MFKKENTDKMKGISIICIILHHIVQQILNPGILTPFKGIGYLFVSIFLFLSGYGLMKSYMKKENYLQDFKKRRLMKIYMPFLLVNLVHLIINIFIKGKEYTFKSFLFNLTGMHLMSSAMWYMITILFWYLIFYIVCKISKKIMKKYG